VRHERAAEAVRIRKLVVEPAGEQVFLCGRLGDEGEDPGISTLGPIGEREEVEKGHNPGIDADPPAGDLAGARRARRDRIDRGRAQVLPQALVGEEEEGPVLAKGPAESAAEPVALEWRLLG